MDIVNIVNFILPAIIPFMLAITVHEASHAYAAYLLGDNTAKSQGRLTLNPFAHIDFIGLAVLLITKMFGWAKPVPINYNIVRRNPNGLAIVSIAGPLSNFLLAVISGILLWVVKLIYFKALTAGYAGTLTVTLTLFIKMLIFSVRINLVLGFFNLLPIPPLDGSKVLINFMPSAAPFIMRYERYGFIILVLLIYTGTISPYIQATAINLSEIIFSLAGIK